MKLQFDLAGQQIRGPNSADDFIYTITPFSVGATVGTPTVSNNYDAVVYNIVNTGARVDLKIDVSQSFANSNKSLSFASLTPSIATVDGTGYVTALTDGTATILAKSGGIERRISLDMQIVATLNTHTLISYRTDAGTSLGAHASAQINALIAGKDAQGNVNSTSGTQTMWASNNHDAAAPVVTRNSGFFGAGLNNITAIGAMNASNALNEDARVHPPLLVTARHIFGANHYQTNNGIIGDKVVFVRTDGSLQTETLIDKWSDPDSDDHWIGLLSNPITGCTPFQIMPTGWQNYIKSLDTNYGNADGTWVGNIPVLARVFHRPDGVEDERVNILSLVGLSSLANVQPYDRPFVGVGRQPDYLTSPLYGWFAPIIGGDSGGPVAMVVNNNLVLLTTFHYTGGGVSIERDAAEYETQMRRMAALVGDNTAYAFTRADLSSFATY
jgi:hypothetical protein